MELASIKRVIDLLGRKNGYLVDFQTLNSEELARIEQGNFANLEAFYYDRELLLNAMEKLDHKLREYSVDELGSTQSPFKEKILELLKNKRKFIHNILDQDMAIHDSLSASSVVKAKIA